MNNNKTERQVAAIKNGTVIDHIPSREDISGGESS